ncbi:DUF397 domain-containing protein [Lentzea sp. NPDC058450]|uniref:DUF397 domain-containing protein n=1 Tax=Lentzea sp. NPDC058450 TaxID=3346505 RepID=UPI0036681CBE
MIGQEVLALSRGREGWFVSSYSSDSGSCVEVNLDVSGVLVRDSKDRRAERPVLGFSSEAWSLFLKHIC